MSEFGARLRSLRKSRDMTLEGLAEMAGTSKSYLWEMENKASRPSADKALALADALGVTIHVLMGVEPPSVGQDDEVAIERYRRLPEHTRETVRLFINTLHSNQPARRRRTR